MAEQDLIRALCSDYKKMKPEERIAEIRDVASKSPEDAEIIRQMFPEFFEEAFPQPQPHGAGVRRSESGWQPSLVAKPQR